MSNPRPPSSRPTPPGGQPPQQPNNGGANQPRPATRVPTTLTGAVPAGRKPVPPVAKPPAPTKPQAAAVQVKAAPRAAVPTRTGSPSFFDKPLLSTIDRYVLGSFVKNYLISLVVLIGLYVVLDMVFNFDEFVKVNGRDAADTESVSTFHTLLTIADFYFFQSFRVFNHLAGIIPVVATAFTLVRMSRFNELAALLAAGVPLLRIAAPIILASFLVNGGLLMVNQEIIVPSMVDKLTRDRGDISSQLEGRGLEAMPVADNDTLFASQYQPPHPGQPATMRLLHVLEKRPGQYTAELAAESATFDPDHHRWTLVNGQRTIIPADPSQPRHTEPVRFYEQAVSPETIGLFVSRGDFVDLLSTQRIKDLLNQGSTVVGQRDLMRVRDARWANYVLNVVLVLLTIPCVLTREPTQLRTAAARVFILIGACMATIFITQNLAGQPSPQPSLASVWSAIMAWLPIFMFLPIAVWLLDRLKT